MTMSNRHAAALLSALSSEARLSAWRRLLEAGAPGMTHGDLAAALGLPKPTLSFHLRDLRQAGLVESRREGRTTVYTASALAGEALAAFLMETCCGHRPELCLDRTGKEGSAMSLAPDKVYNVLFLCTGNSARSIMAECILQREGQGRFRTFSAGSAPRGEIAPEAMTLLVRNNYPTGHLRSKSWDEFAKDGAPVMDFVFTVCDDAAGETCPAWPGQPLTAHWGVPDPVALEGDARQRALAFADTFRMLTNRISVFCALPLRSLDKLTLQKRLDEIGGMDAGNPSSADVA
ncbi:metalloregulator ArsR/SmtB family transcription factor [Caenispirillum salinarum]|uniref:metalloregulator ArsR/SmtB family transcription factor n=1 Tax=Caenispirillum salinarum TaxID=859058 RepID=UPI00385080F4